MQTIYEALSTEDREMIDGCVEALSGDEKLIVQRILKHPAESKLHVDRIVRSICGFTDAVVEHERRSNRVMPSTPEGWIEFAIEEGLIAPRCKGDSMTTAVAAELLTREEAAEYLGLKPQTLAKWACRGRYGVPFIRLGGLVRYRRSDLDAWLESRTVRSGSDRNGFGGSLGPG